MTEQRLLGGLATLVALVLTTPIAAQQQVPSGSTLGTVGSGVAGELNPGAATWVPPTGPAPRRPTGKPDLTAVWEHAYVPDMSLSSARPGLQTGAGELPYTTAGRANITSYDPEKDGDYTGMCMPFGLVRSVNAPYPFQIV